MSLLGLKIPEPTGGGESSLSQRHGWKAALAWGHLCEQVRVSWGGVISHQMWGGVISGLEL
eukprot:261388-Pelagomonas_calceolata.AAC.1